MRQELRTLLTTKRLYLAMAAMFTCLMLGSVPMWLMSAGWGDAYRPSALVQAVSPVFFGGLILYLPCCAACAYAPYQVDEVQTGFCLLRAIHTSYKKYAVQKLLTAFISGFVAVALPFWLNAVCWNLIAHPCDPVAFPDHELFLHGLYGTWYRIAYGLPMYAWMGTGIGLCGGMVAVMALAAAVWVPDKLICVTLSAGIYYFWSYGLFNLLTGLPILSPSMLYNDALTLERGLNALALNSLAVLIALFLYLTGLNRRLKHV